MEERIIYVGLDVHKETIAIGEALEGREAPVFAGTIENTSQAAGKLLKRYEERGLQPRKRDRRAMDCSVSWRARGGSAR